MKTEKFEEIETSFGVPAHNKALLKELKDYASRHHFNLSIKGTVADVTMPKAVFESEDFKKLMLKLELEFEKELYCTRSKENACSTLNAK